MKRNIIRDSYVTTCSIKSQNTSNVGSHTCFGYYVPLTTISCTISLYLRMLQMRSPLPPYHNRGPLDPLTEHVPTTSLSRTHLTDCLVNFYILDFNSSLICLFSDHKEVNRSSMHNGQDVGS